MGVRLRSKNKKCRHMIARLSGVVTREDRQLSIARRYMAGEAQWVIGKSLDLSAATVNRELTAIRKQWREDRVQNYDDRVAEELAKIDNLERIAHEAWVRSCEEETTRRRKVEKAREKPKVVKNAKGEVVKTVESGKMVAVKESVDQSRKGQSGNPAFLDRIAWCIEQRCKILDIIKKPEEKATGTTVINFFDVVSGVPEVIPDAAEERIARVALPVKIEPKE